jgi:HEAT repeat protein
MTPEQQELASGLIITPRHGRSRVSPQEFAERFPSALEGGRLALALLEEAAAVKDPANLGATILIGATFGFTADHVPLLCELLRAEWHWSHESIVTALQRLKDPRAVDALYDASLVSHGYLAYDEFYGLARKCTWALADIGTPDALAKLRQMAGSENPLVAGYAQKRIDRWSQ